MMKTKTKFKQTEIGMIPEDWEVSSFGNLLQGSTRNGIYKTKEFHGSGIKIINMGELFAYPKIGQPPMKRVKLDSDEIERFGVHGGDLLFARRSLVAEGAGQCSLVVGNGEPRVFESSIIRARPDPTKVDSTYLFYVFRSTFGKYLMDTILRQVAVSGITGSDLVTLKVPMPSLDEQKGISKILSRLDDKIELNQQMNKTLEAIGQAIFKHWFVDFEFPNEEGKPYKSSGGGMTDSELGKIPRGWKVGKYSELVEVTTGKGLKREELLENGEFPVMGASGELGRTSNFLFNEDLILTGRVGTLGTVYIVRDRVWISDNVLISKARLKEFFYYSYHIIRNFDFESLNRGSTQPLITQTDLKNQTCLIPHQTILILFNKILSSIFDKIYANHLQNKNLSQTRDSLLPKLMSGKIRVPVEA